jgi:hypothetical protein
MSIREAAFGPYSRPMCAAGGYNPPAIDKKVKINGLRLKVSEGINPGKDKLPKPF